MPIDYNEPNYRKYNHQVQKYFNLLPKTNEASLKNSNTLVIRYKINNTKWQYDNYPFYWRELATTNLKNREYIKIRTGRQALQKITINLVLLNTAKILQ